MIAMIVFFAFACSVPTMALFVLWAGPELSTLVAVALLTSAWWSR